MMQLLLQQINLTAMQIIKRLFTFGLILITLSNCSKSEAPGCQFDACYTVAPASEIQAVQAYLMNNNITTATQHCSGLFYEIVTPGNGNAATPCSSVNVNYVGKQTNGATFDSRTSVGFSLSNVVLGWRIGIPMIKEGGRIRLYVPPTLGYGNQQAGSLPPNSILIFDVTVNAVY